MEYFGLIAFVLILSYMSLPGKVEKLHKKVEFLEKNNKKNRGELVMSEVLKDLVGKNCTIVESSGLEQLKCTVLAVDDEWIKVSFDDKKGNRKTSIKRIDSINEIREIDDL